MTHTNSYSHKFQNRRKFSTRKEQAKTKYTPKPWSEEQYQRFIAKVDKDKPQYFVYQLMFRYGMRKGEALSVSLADIHKGEIHLKRILSNTKFGVEKTLQTERVVPVDESYLKELRDYAARTGVADQQALVLRISPCGLSFRFKQDCQIAGIEPTSIHVLRRSHIVMLLTTCQDKNLIAARTGWSWSTVKALVPSTNKPKELVK